MAVKKKKRAAKRGSVTRVPSKLLEARVLEELLEQVGSEFLIPLPVARRLLPALVAAHDIMSTSKGWVLAKLAGESILSLASRFGKLEANPGMRSEF